MTDLLDADAIMSAVENGEDPSAMGGGGEIVGEAAEASVTEQAVDSFRKELNVNGQKIEVTDPAKYDQWAQQGYSYSQRMEELNAQKSEWEKEKTALEQRLSQYSEVDGYAKENPDWWNHVEENWNNREIHKMSPELQEAIKPFMSEFQEVKGFINDFQRQKEEQQAAQQDQELEAEVKTLGEQFPEISFQAKDASGQSLEAQILKHADAQGIPSFKAAFYDYYQGNLQKLYETRGRAAVEKDLAERKKNGILGTSQAPVKTQGIQPLANPSKKSWADVLAEAKQAVGIA